MIFSSIHIKTVNVLWGVCMMLLLMGCDSSEITKARTQQEHEPVVNEFVPPQLRKVDTNTILTLIHYLERDHDTSFENRMQIQKLKDSINFDALNYSQRTGLTIGRDGKIPTH